MDSGILIFITLSLTLSLSTPHRQQKVRLCCIIYSDIQDSGNQLMGHFFNVVISVTIQRILNYFSQETTQRASLLLLLQFLTYPYGVRLEIP